LTIPLFGNGIAFGCIPNIFIFDLQSLNPFSWFFGSSFDLSLFSNIRFDPILSKTVLADRFLQLRDLNVSTHPAFPQSPFASLMPSIRPLV
jgi:hypothetical protein